MRCLATKASTVSSVGESPEDGTRFPSEPVGRAGGTPWCRARACPRAQLIPGASYSLFPEALEDGSAVCSETLFTKIVRPSPESKAVQAACSS